MKCFCGSEMISINSQKIDFFQCPSCSYLKKAYIPNSDVAKQRYDNHICDDGYFKYMEKIKDMITPFLIEGNSLDYGCGKEYALARLIDNCDYYDLFYYPNLNNKQYNNIILNEVFEHIENPYEELLKIKKMLDKNGRIIILTQTLPDEFNSWWYVRDITHVSFFNEKSMTKLASLVNMELFFDKNQSIYVLKA